MYEMAFTDSKSKKSILLTYNVRTCLAICARDPETCLTGLIHFANIYLLKKDNFIIDQLKNNLFDKYLEFLDFSNLTYILDKIRFYKEKKLKINVIIEQVQNDIESNFIEFLYKKLINILGIAFDLNKIKIYKKENNLKIEAIEPILKFVELNID